MIHTSTETIFKGCVLKNTLPLFLILLVTVLLPLHQQNWRKQ
jgi:hypothetical protein